MDTNSNDSKTHTLFMGLAIELAQTAYDNDEVPVGAVIIQRRNSEVLAAFANQMRELKSSIAHAEMLAIQKAMNVLQNERLVGCDIYVSLVIIAKQNYQLLCHASTLQVTCKLTRIGKKYFA